MSLLFADNMCVEDLSTTKQYIDTYLRAGISSEYELERNIMEKVKALFEKQKPIFVKMTCHNCGAGVYQKAEDHIFKCKFCRTTYFVGTEMIQDGGELNDKSCSENIRKRS